MFDMNKKCIRDTHAANAPSNQFFAASARLYAGLFSFTYYFYLYFRGFVYGLG